MKSVLISSIFILAFTVGTHANGVHDSGYYTEAAIQYLARISSSKEHIRQALKELIHHRWSSINENRAETDILSSTSYKFHRDWKTIKLDNLWPEQKEEAEKTIKLYKEWIEKKVNESIGRIEDSSSLEDQNLFKDTKVPHFGTIQRLRKNKQFQPEDIKRLFLQEELAYHEAIHSQLFKTSIRVKLWLDDLAQCIIV